MNAFWETMAPRKYLLGEQSNGSRIAREKTEYVSAHVDDNDAWGDVDTVSAIFVLKEKH